MSLTFLLDVDNTLLDNDRVKDDLAIQIRRLVGADHATQFWTRYEQVRRELDYVDFPRTLERFHAALPYERGYAQLASLLLCYPFEKWLHSAALQVIAHLKTLGCVVILSDGDPVFQAAKIARAGLAQAVDGNVLIYVHKEQQLDEVMRRFPAERYVLVDDKARVLAQAKAEMGERVVTAHVRQGKYAAAAAGVSYPAPDLTVHAIGDLRTYRASDFLRRRQRAS